MDRISPDEAERKAVSLSDFQVSCLVTELSRTMSKEALNLCYMPNRSMSCIRKESHSPPSPIPQHKSCPKYRRPPLRKSNTQQQLFGQSKKRENSNMLTFFSNLDRECRKCQNSPKSREYLLSLLQKASEFGQKLTCELGSKKDEQKHKTRKSVVKKNKVEIMGKINEINKASILLKMRNGKLEEFKKWAEKEIERLVIQGKSKNVQIEKLLKIINEEKNDKRNMYQKIEAEKVEHSRKITQLNQRVQNLETQIRKFDDDRSKPSAPVKKSGNHPAHSWASIREELQNDYMAYKRKEDIENLDDRIRELEKEVEKLTDTLEKQKMIIYHFANKLYVKKNLTIWEWIRAILTGLSRIKS